MSGISWGDTGKRTVIVEKTVSPKDEDVKETTDLDSIMHLGVRNICRMMNHITAAVKSSAWDRETVQNLKDIMTMLNDLKKREQDLIDSLSDEDLAALNDPNKQ